MAEQFDVPKSQMEGFMKAIDERWLERTAPSFYTLEGDWADLLSEIDLRTIT